MKKTNWFVYRVAGSGENEVILREEPEESKFDMKIFDNNNVEVKEYNHILNDYKVVIIMKFRWKRDFSEIEADKIEYLLKSSSDWEPIKEGKKIKIKSGKKSEFDKVIKEAHKKLLKQRFSDDHFGVSKRVDHGNDIQFNIIEDENKKEIEINFYKKDGDANVAPLRIGESQIYIEPEYYPSKKITYEEGQQEIYDEAEGKSRWTTGWIIFFVIFGVIIVLGVIFHKKIWRWIKGEREQEKKVREQIDIF